jgi:predicted acyl esterase
MRRAQIPSLIGLVASVGFPLFVSAQAAGTSAPAATRPPRGPDPAVAEYFATQVDKEEMVRIPMRDGVRLNGTLFFDKDQRRSNLPTVLVFFPYQINGVSAENEQLLRHGYAIAYVNARGRYYS